MTPARDLRVLPDDVPVGVTRTLACAGCGSDYDWTSTVGHQWPTEYCTRKCRRAASPRRRAALDSIDGQLDEGMVLLICGRCETPFGWTPRPLAFGQNVAPTYHSKQCSDRAREKRKRNNRRARVGGRVVAIEEQQAEQVERERDAEVAAMASAARELLLPASHCMTCGKVASPTKEAAKEAKRAIEQRAGRTNEVRYYQCPDGWWHWTRMDATLDGFRARQW